MLVLTRKSQQQIMIGNEIRVTILSVKGNCVRVGIEAPRDVRVIRTEIADRPAREPSPAARDESVGKPVGGGLSQCSSVGRDHTAQPAIDAFEATVDRTGVMPATRDLRQSLPSDRPSLGATRLVGPMSARVVALRSATAI